MLSYPILPVMILLFSTPFSQDLDADSVTEGIKAFIRNEVHDEITLACSTPLMVMIEDMERELDLKPSSTKLLRLAAKGASEAFADDLLESASAWIYKDIHDENIQIIINNRRVILPGATADQRRTLEAIDTKEIYPKYKFIVTRSSYSMQVRHNQGSSTSTSTNDSGLDKVVSNPKWKRIYDKCIAPEEHEEYMTLVKDRRQGALSEMLLAFLEIRLCLSDDQKSELLEWLYEQKELGDVEISQDQDLMSRAFSALNFEPIQHFFTEDQSRLWRIYYGSIVNDGL